MADNCKGKPKNVGRDGKDATRQWIKEEQNAGKWSELSAELSRNEPAVRR